jgi:hypothetical protein
VLNVGSEEIRQRASPLLWTNVRGFHPRKRRRPLSYVLIRAILPRWGVASRPDRDRCCAPTKAHLRLARSKKRGVLQMAVCSTIANMKTSIQARLDQRSRRRLAVLVRELGWTPSQVVREGLRALEASYLRRKRKGVIGLGKFRSGVADLGSNKKHLRGFGRNDGPK